MTVHKKCLIQSNCKYVYMPLCTNAACRIAAYVQRMLNIP